MKSQKLNTLGIAHVAVIAVVFTGFIVAGTFTLVLHAHNSNKSSNASITSDKSSATQSKLHASNSSSESHASTQDTQAPSQPAKSSPASTTPQPATKSTQTKPKTVAPTTATKLSSTPSSTVTPLSALTAVLANLLNGGTAQVTANTVAVPGPITTAQAQPIVFTANGHSYYAYRQGQAPDFNASASSIANTMAIVTANTSGVALSGAHLDKAGNLVDANSHAAGYSIGGN